MTSCSTLRDENTSAIHPQQSNSQNRLDDLFLADINDSLKSMTAQERLQWSLTHLPGQQALTSSFGIQSAVLLHMMTQELPDIPVILVDTGYLFPETYQFIDQLTERLQLNLKVYQGALSSAWLEARHGPLWSQGLEGLEHYHQLQKVKPMHHAFKDLAVATWYSGVRRQQAHSRSHADIVSVQQDRYKVYPIVDWSNQDVHRYLKRHQLPYHPLWEKGYVSVGDVHTSQPLSAGMTEEQTRFFGLKRECGLHQF